MDRVNKLYNNLQNDIPFCFIKMNDGEISAMLNSDASLSRGDETSSTEMSEKMKNCLTYINPEYYIGLPCFACYNYYFNESIQYIIDNIHDNTEEKSNFINNNILNANILINTNIDKTIDVLVDTMKNKNIIIVTNEENSKNVYKLKSLNIIPYKTIIVSKQNAFMNDYERVKDEYKTFNNGDIVICLCGPLGRILCHEWFKNNNTLTCLELGSLFDPLLKNKAYLYHTGIHKYCEGCFPSNEANESKLLKLCTEPLNKECYYFNDKQSYYGFYNYNILKIKKNNEIRLEKEPNNPFLLKIRSLCENKNKILKLELNEHDGIFEVGEIIPRENPNPFYIVYHIASVSNKWINLTIKSYNKIVKSGILDDNNLKGIKISYLGEEKEINLLKLIWNHPKVQVIHFGENYKLYEYPAMGLIKDICEKEECNIMYFHCKGLLHDDNSINDWIDYLEYFNIEKYKFCLDKLIDYDAVSCNYYHEHGEPFYKTHNYPFVLYRKHFSGNYWWTKSSHINKIKRLEYSKESRYYPEFWMCNDDFCKIWSYYVSSINFGEKHDILERSVYEGTEHLDFNFYRENTFKHYNKDELFNICRKSYYSKQFLRLDKVSDIYLSYFEKLKDDDSYHIKFWNSYANFYTNPTKSKKLLKSLCNSSTSNNNIENFAKCNLEMLYPKISGSIPKLIHMIYFKGIEFVKYHYACVLSVRKHMPDYKIIIYNDVEPDNNIYWEKIKEFVTIEKTNPPKFFDDFPLKYIQYSADVVRMEKIYEHGGIYLDLDLLVIKNFENVINTGKDFYISEENSKENNLLINCFLASKPKNKFILKWLNTFKTGLRMNNWAYHIRNSNKLLLDENKHYLIKYNIKILNSETFLPFKWEEREKFVNIKQNLTENIHGIHLFETILHNDLINNTYIDEIVSEEENK
jgi:hypothetical protein